jgi:hypothetical protein
MAIRFRRGALCYDKHGREYTVDTVEDGIVYCRSSTDAETEFPEADLLTQTEWDQRSDGKKGRIYERLKQSKLYLAPTGKLERAASEQALTKIERLLPGILDYTAFTAARRFLTETGDSDLVATLSIPKCREVFDAAKAEVKASLLASVLGTPVEVLVSAGRLGDNLMRAMLDKFIAASQEDFIRFGDRRRR